MNPAVVLAIVEGLATLGPVLAELASLAGKLKSGAEITEADLTRAETARRQAFDALRRELQES
jgi:hypothetical protein